MMGVSVRGAAGSGRPPFFFVCLVLLLLAAPPVLAAKSDGVGAKTRDPAYKAGEPVEIVLTNGSGSPICTPAAAGDPGKAVRNLEVKNPRGIWDAFSLESRTGSGEELEACGELRPGDSVAFQWRPMVIEKGKLVSPGPGLYRLTVIYLFKRPGKPPVFGTAKTNEFTIE